MEESKKPLVTVDSQKVGVNYSEKGTVINVEVPTELVRMLVIALSKKICSWLGIKRKTGQVIRIAEDGETRSNTQ